MDKILVKNKDYIWEPFDDELVLLNLTDGQQHIFNAVARSFFQKIDGKRKVDEIFDLMLVEFEVEREVLEKDFEALTKSLLDKEIICLR